jgi:hypothetical protein
MQAWNWIAVFFLRTIVCIVALTILMVIPASAQSGPIQITSRSDENCIRKPAEFSIPVGYFAEKFALVSLSAGRSCGPNREALTHKAFQIRNVSSNGSERPVFNYGQDDGRAPVVDVPGGLAALKLPAGRYRLYVNAARDCSVVINYLVSAGDVPPPPPTKIGSEKSVQVQCAKDGRCTAISSSDNKGARTTALFTVPAGKKAVDFQLVRLTSGQNLYTNMELTEKGFQITALVGSAPEALRFKYHQSGSNSPSQTPVSLAQLQLPPGTYKVRVDGAKSNVVELRFAIKAGYAEGDQTGHLPPKPAKTIVCHNDGKNFTAQSFADDRCVLTACSFTVPANRLAVQFKVQSLTPGSGCYTGMPSKTAGFQIVRSGTQQILYNYIGVVTPNPAGLNVLNLRPGNYLLQTSVARNSGASLTFMIENPFEAAPETSRVGAQIIPRPGLYRMAGGGQTFELSAISPSSMRISQWQTATPEPPESRGAFYNTGTATLLADGVTWRSQNRDVAGYCCGNNVELEFRFLSSTSFRGIRYRMWPLTGATPGAGDSWQPTGADELRLVGELAATRAGGTGTTAGSNAQSQPSALVNLARGKPAVQSSTLSAFGGFGTADRAVDGNTNGDYFARSVTHTEEDNRPQPWWQVDLGVSSQIDHVILWNRRDCCGERLAAFWVFVSESPFPAGDLSALLRDGRIWRYEFSGVAGPQSRIAVGKPGRYIRVQLSGRGPLSLTEVEVFGK